MYSFMCQGQSLWLDLPKPHYAIPIFSSSFRSFALLHSSTLCLSIVLCLAFSLCLCLSVSVSLSLSVCPCLSVSVCQSLSPSVSVNVSFLVPLILSHNQSLSCSRTRERRKERERELESRSVSQAVSFNRPVEIDPVETSAFPLNHAFSQDGWLASAVQTPMHVRGPPLCASPRRPRMGPIKGPVQLMWHTPDPQWFPIRADVADAPALQVQARQVGRSALCRDIACGTSWALAVPSGCGSSEERPSAAMSS